MPPPDVENEELVVQLGRGSGDRDAPSAKKTTKTLPFSTATTDFIKRGMSALSVTAVTEADQASLVEMERVLGKEIMPHTPFSSATASDLKDIGCLGRHPVMKGEDWQSKLKAESVILRDYRQKMEELERWVTDSYYFATTWSEQSHRTTIDLVLLTVAKCYTEILNTPSPEKPQGEQWRCMLGMEYSISKQTFESQAYGERSFSGRVDYVFAPVPEDAAKAFQGDPSGVITQDYTLNDPKNRGRINILEAKGNEVDRYVAQSVIEVAAFCREVQLNSLKACLSNGVRWIFFIYVRNNKKHSYWKLPEVTVAPDPVTGRLVNLDLVVAMLELWITTSQESGTPYYNDITA